jgi:methylenetetrahydrofolate--tRNA-(uracil-5-)-methyltransferase
MNVNFGLFPPLAKSPNRSPDGERLRGTAKTMAKRRALTARALFDLDAWAGSTAVAAAAQTATLVPASEGAPVPEPHPR